LGLGLDLARDHIGGVGKKEDIVVGEAQHQYLFIGT
jgi:hypothetical protein